jgi:hypothetical protein
MPTPDAGVIQAEGVIETLKHIRNLDEEYTLQLNDESMIDVDPDMLDHILYTYSCLKTEEKKSKFVEMLVQSEESFDKTYEFCRTHYQQ